MRYADVRLTLMHNAIQYNTILFHLDQIQSLTKYQCYLQQYETILEFAKAATLHGVNGKAIVRGQG